MTQSQRHKVGLAWKVGEEGRRFQTSPLEALSPLTCYLGNKPGKTERERERKKCWKTIGDAICVLHFIYIFSPHEDRSVIQ